MSPRSNEVFVSHSGVESIDSDIPFGWAYTPGGIRFVTGTTISNVSVYDLSGRLVMIIPEVINDQEVLLAPGAYIITTPASSAILRVLVRH